MKVELSPSQISAIRKSLYNSITTIEKNIADNEFSDYAIADMQKMLSDLEEAYETLKQIKDGK